MVRSAFFLFLVFLLLLSSPIKAGELDSPAPPDAEASAMFTLEDVFERLATGAPGEKRGEGYIEPLTGPGSTGYTVDEVMAACPVSDNIAGATQDEVLEGHTYWSLRTDGSWGTQAGALPIRTISDATTAVAAGYYSATDLVSVDPDLQSSNLRSGVDLFGITGDPNVVDTSSGDATAGEILAGKKAWVDGVEVTGELEVDCTCSGTLDGTRWCDNLDGTVTDLTTCLVWLKKADCGGQWPWTETFALLGAHSRASLLYDGSADFSGGDCALSDRSTWGSWRLPTINELVALTSHPERVRFDTPRAFTNVQGADYWSSTSELAGAANALAVYLVNGNLNGDNKVTGNWVWPVRRAE